MKKSTSLVLLALTALAGCSTPPQPPEGKGVGPEAVTIAYGKILNVKEYTHIYGETIAAPIPPKTKKVDFTKPLLGKSSQMGSRVGHDELEGTVVNTPEPILSIDMVELHVQNEQGPTFKIDQVKNGSYYMGQRVRITMKENVAKVTPYQ